MKEFFASIYSSRAICVVSSFVAKAQNHRVQWNSFCLNLVSSRAIGKNDNTRTVQAESSKFTSVLFDQGFLILIPPRWVGTDWNAIWQYFALIRLLFITSICWVKGFVSEAEKTMSSMKCFMPQSTQAKTFVDWQVWLLEPKTHRVLWNNFYLNLLQ